jgi:hypothetical protein
LSGPLWWAAGTTAVWAVPRVCAYVRGVLLWFFAGFKQGFPGCFRGPSGLSPTPGANGSLPCECWRLQGFRVEDPSGARKGGRTDAGSGLGRPPWADRPRPISARFVRPFAPVGPQVIMHFAPSTCMILMMSSSRPRWRFFVHEVRSFALQSPGVFLRSTSVLATIGIDFIKLMNTNKTP